MNEILKDKLKRLVDDEILLKAVKEVFDNRIEIEKPTDGDFDDDVKLGQKYRAFVQAQKIINKAFDDIRGFKHSATKETKPNRAR